MAQKIQNRKKAGRESSSLAPVLVAIVVALIAAAAIIAVVSGGDDGGGDETALAGSVETAPVTVEGEPLPPAEDLSADPAVGQPFPALSGQALLSGDPMEIPAGGGPKVVIFLAHWCPHCQREVPRITDWVEENGMPEGVDLYAVSTAVQEGQGNHPPASWLQEEEWPVPTMADSDDGTAANAVGLTGFPYFVAVGGDGEVVARASGELSTEQFEALVEVARGA